MAEKVKKIIPWLVVLVSLIVGVGFCSPWSLIRADVTIPSVTVGNATPTVSAINLFDAGGGDLDLNENTTTTITCTAQISDPNGGNDVVSATATVYRSGEGASCTQNDNNCYPDITCTLSGALDNYKNATCTATVWFHADPTDDGAYASSTGWSSQTWQCQVIGEDSGGLTHSATDSSPPNMVTKTYLIVDNAIGYGNMAPGATSSVSETITATTTGNCPIDVNLSGTDMTSVSTTTTIPVDQQQYATSSIDWADPPLSGATDLTGTPTTLEVEMPKPTASSSTSTDDAYWRIGIPNGQYPAYYSGTTTIASTED